MRRRAHLLMFGAATAVIAVTVHAWSGDATGEASSVAPFARTQRANAMREAVPPPRRTQASLPRIERAAEPTVAAATVKQDTATAIGAEAEDSIAADRQMSQLAARCDMKISGESIDPEWSRARHEQFGAFFARPSLQGTRLKAVDCRTTMCRVELSHRSGEDRERFIQHLSDLAGPDGVVFAHIETDDDLDIAVFVTRDGIALP